MSFPRRSLYSVVVSLPGDFETDGWVGARSAWHILYRVRLGFYQPLVTAARSTVLLGRAKPLYSNSTVSFLFIFPFYLLAGIIL